MFAARFLAICTRHTYIDEQLEMESMTTVIFIAPTDTCIYNTCSCP